ncbi:MAG: LysR family transcriptional regulator [Lachnospiraceae bacterium]|nr:LysR family transcriptional regulator [Lachnospiraceae bacterium]
MELQQLQYFLTCAQEGSVTKAAEALYTSQPHVSQVIKTLENELGVVLFHRSASGITLTKEGEQIHFYAESILKNAGLISQISRDASVPALRIAANPSSSLAFLLGDFIQTLAGSDLTLHYRECGIEQMMELLQNRQYDLGFLFVPENKRAAFSYLTARHHLLYTPLRSTDLVLHAGRKNPWYGKPSIKPEELSACSFIQPEDDFFSVEDLLTEHPLFRSGKVSLHTLIRTNSDHLMIRMLQQTDLCNVGSFWLRNNYGDYDFTQTIIEGFEKQISFGYLHSDDHFLREEAKAFVEELTHIIENDSFAR